MRTKLLRAFTDDIREAYAGGATLEALAKTHGVAVGTIRNLLKSEQVELRSPGRPLELPRIPSGQRMDSVSPGTEKSHYNRVRRLKKKYNLTPEEYENKVKSQDNKCAICQKVPTKKLVVDHCHSTGEIRGLLCNKCNMGLGHFLDSSETLESALRYLQPKT